MFNAEALEFEFAKDTPVKERGRMGKVWDHFQAVKSAVNEKGMIVPQHLVADLFGFSRQRVNELVNLGRFETINIGGVRYITERSVIAFGREERKAGRPPNLPQTKREMWNIARAATRPK